MNPPRELLTAAAIAAMDGQRAEDDLVGFGHIQLRS